MDKKKEERTQSYDTECADNKLTTENSISDFKSKCQTACSYLNQIYGNYAMDDNKKRAACIYMYYWIYHDLLNDIESDSQIQGLYEAILQAENNEDAHYIKFKDLKISHNELKKLKDIYEMNTELNNIKNDKENDNYKKCECAKKCHDLYMKHKNACKLNSNKDFCNALDNIRDRYNTRMINTHCVDGAPKLLPSFQTFSSITLILTTIFIIIVISFFIIILYKVS